jgi:hypothetical protein
MTLRRRIDRLERVNPAFYSDVSEIPTPVLDAILRRACSAREWPVTPEEKALHRRLEECGHARAFCFGANF